jgi:hypothetical protein
MLRTFGRTLVAHHYTLYQLSLAVLCMALTMVILWDCPVLKAFLFSGLTFGSYALGQGIVALARRAGRRPFLD